MNHVRDEIRIEAPIGHVWAFLCDTSRWHDWDPRSEYTDFSGPVDRVGTTFIETGRMMGREMRARHGVVEVEQQRLLRHRSDRGFDVAFRLAPDGEATRLTIEVDYERLGRLPGFVSRPLVERVGRGIGPRLKALAEATVPAHA